MSELKAYKGDIYIPVYGSVADAKVYLKSEADKVIAELKQKTNEAQIELELWRDGSIISEAHQKELDGKRHSDYKRCLAMYHYCAIKALYELDFKGNDAEWKWYSKWMHKWFNLAMKFKEEYK